MHCSKLRIVTGGLNTGLSLSSQITVHKLHFANVNVNVRTHRSVSSLELIFRKCHWSIFVEICLIRYSVIEHPVSGLTRNYISGKSLSIHLSNSLSLKLYCQATGILQACIYYIIVHFIAWKIIV